MSEASIKVDRCTVYSYDLFPMRPTLLTLAAAALFATVSPAPAQTPAPTATPAAVASPAPAKLTRAEKRAQKKAAQEAAATPAPAAAPATTATPGAVSATPAPATAAASPAPVKKTRAEKKAAKTEKATELSNATPAPGGGPGMVWVNTKSHAYHDSTSRYYGKTKEGKYMTEQAAIAEGDHAHKHKDKANPAAAPVTE